MNAWPLQKDCKTFYGDPDPNGDGVPDRGWESGNLARVIPPWRMCLAWDTTKVPKYILIHERCAQSLERVLNKIWDEVGRSQDQIDRLGLDRYGGAYNFRMKRGGHSLSMHSYACAIDLDPARNPMGRPWAPLAGGMSMLAVSAFEAEGWTFGGRWQHGECDPMHFQAARVS
jgi:hypothetical protein